MVHGLSSAPRAGAQCGQCTMCGPGLDPRRRALRVGVDEHAHRGRVEPAGGADDPGPQPPLGLLRPVQLAGPLAGALVRAGAAWRERVGAVGRCGADGHLVAGVFVASALRPGLSLPITEYGARHAPAREAVAGEHNHVRIARVAHQPRVRSGGEQPLQPPVSGELVVLPLAGRVRRMEPHPGGRMDVKAEDAAPPVRRPRGPDVGTRRCRPHPKKWTNSRHLQLPPLSVCRPRCGQ